MSDKTDTDSGTVTITASSVEELLQKIQDYMQLAKSDTVLTEAEKEGWTEHRLLRLGAAYGKQGQFKAWWRCRQCRTSGRKRKMISMPERQAS